MINKCLLIVPPEKKSESSKGELFQEGKFQPLGLAYIAAFLRKKDASISVQLIDSLVENLTEEELIGKIQEIKPDIIGITVLTQQAEMALAISKTIKINNLCKYLVLGGPHVHFEYLNIIKNEYVDFCVCGEGELTFYELVKVLKNNGDLTKVQGIVFKDIHGDIVRTEDRPFIENIDELPFPARDLLKNDLYKAPISLNAEKSFASILATRGCPFNCHFCSLTKMWDKRQRRRGVENVLDEIEILTIDYGVKAISFVDDLLVLNRKWAIDLCKGLCKRGLNKKIIWDCCGRIKLMTPELLKEMKTAGCVCVIYGIEFGSQRMLDFVNKGITIKDIRETVSVTNKVGIAIKGLFMMGYPTETKETLQDTINLAKSLKMDFITCSVVAPYPGTDLYKYSLENNLLNNSDQIDIMQLRFKALKLEHLSLEDVIEYIDKLLREYMLSPSYIYRMIVKHPKLIIRFGPKYFVKILRNFVS